MKDINLETSYRWKNNTERNFREITCDDVDWIHLGRIRTSGRTLRTR
jgi:hypothetical protein